MQGLVEQYQPQNPVEWHLVQQVAMGMLRQHRLWAAEAAIVYEQALEKLESLRQQRNNQESISSFEKIEGF